MADTVLEAATREFAANGLQHGDLDRIAADAGVDQGEVLREFGSAEALFDRVLDESFGRLAAAVHFDPSDLPRFAGDVFDIVQRDPTVLRLSMWQQLERPDADTAVDTALADWIDRIDDTNGGASELDAFSAAELLAFALALAKAELSAPRRLTAGIAEGAGREDRRARVEEAVRRVVGHHA